MCQSTRQLGSCACLCWCLYTRTGRPCILGFFAGRVYETERLENVLEMCRPRFSGPLCRPRLTWTARSRKVSQIRRSPCHDGPCPLTCYEPQFCSPGMIPFEAQHAYIGSVHPKSSLRMWLFRMLFAWPQCWSCPQQVCRGCVDCQQM